MVDFQSRDRRTRGHDDEGDGSATEESGSGQEEADEESAETVPDDNPTDETASVGVAVVTVSDDRTVGDDPVGDAVIDALDGHELVTRELLGRNHDSVQGAVDALVNRNDVDAVVTAGGTGIDTRDITVEAVHPLFEKALPGFGELFRRRYHDRVGTDVIATRATAGIADGTPVFCLPGAIEAARLGASEIVSEQAGQLAEPDDGDTA
jgi:molybdenum cofactor biosynthesis protein B